VSGKFKRINYGKTGINRKGVDSKYESLYQESQAFCWLHHFQPDSDLSLVT